MKIGITGPVTLSRLAPALGHPAELPTGYEFPLIADMVTELLRRGHDVSVFTLDPHITSPRTFEAEKLTVHVGRMRSKHRARDLYAAERRDLEFAMKGDPCDLIHAHWTYEFALAAQASGQPYVVTAHDSPLDNVRLYRLPYWWIRAGIAWRVVTPSLNLSAVSPYIVDHFRRYFRGGNARLIPNGVPSEMLAEQGPAATQLRGSAPTFATILGGWDRRKNGMAAIRAFALTRRELPSARMVMFGRGYGVGEEAQAYALKHSISSDIEFAGHTESRILQGRMRGEIDILVHPARIESFGMVLVEAIALGVTVIAGLNSGGVPWTLDSGRCGVLVDIESPSALATAMVALAQDNQRRQELGRVAREYINEKFTMPPVMSAYEEWYEAAVTSWPRPVATESQ